MSVCLSDNPQSNIRDEIEQENTNLVQCHPRIVQGVKLLHRHMKPSAMQSIHPLVCAQEAQPPHEQDTIVDDSTSEQYLAYYHDTHNLSPTSHYLGI
jgi:hypothetical protein